MKWLIDMGNSRLKAAQYDKGRLSGFVTEAYEGRPSIACLKEFIARRSSLEAIILVSVLGETFQAEVRDYCHDNKISLVWAESSAAAYGVRNNYRVPKKLGSDRFVALVGARKLFPEQYCIVVDCGTAVTVDALTNDGLFRGGVIIPGLQLWGDSLTSRANQLNAHELDSPTVFARDTAQAIGSGSLYGLVAAIEGLCTRMEAQLRQDTESGLTVVRLLCGGDAHLIARHSSLSFEVLPHLVLTGLAEFTK